MSILTTLDDLRKVMEKGMRDEERADLVSIEQRIKRMEDYEALAGRPAIKDLLDWCLRDIGSIKARLSTDRALHQDRREAERLAMIDRKDMLLYIVGLFNVSAQLEAIRLDLEEKKKTFQEYQNGR